MNHTPENYMHIAPNGPLPSNTNAIGEVSAPNSAVEKMPTPSYVSTAPNGPIRTDKASAAAPKEKKTVSKQKMTAPARQTRERFPQRLMRILSDPNIYDVMRWLPHGRSFIILQTDDLAERVKKPEVREYPSFARKLNRWGFRQVRNGPDAGAFYHHLFIRDEPNLCLQMVSQKSRAEKMTQRFLLLLPIA